MYIHISLKKTALYPVSVQRVISFSNVRDSYFLEKNSIELVHLKQPVYSLPGDYVRYVGELIFYTYTNVRPLVITSTGRVLPCCGFRNGFLLNISQSKSVSKCKTRDAYDKTVCARM